MYYKLIIFSHNTYHTYRLVSTHNLPSTLSTADSFWVAPEIMPEEANAAGVRTTDASKASPASDVFALGLLLYQLLLACPEQEELKYANRQVSHPPNPQPLHPPQTEAAYRKTLLNNLDELLYIPDYTDVRDTLPSGPDGAFVFPELPGKDVGLRIKSLRGMLAHNLVSAMLAFEPDKRPTIAAVKGHFFWMKEAALLDTVNRTDLW